MRIDPPKEPEFRPFLDEFADPELEQEYRLSQLSDHQRHINFFAAALIPALLLFGLNDIYSRGWIPELYAITFFRCMWAGTSLILVIVSFRSKSPHMLDVLVAIYLTVGASMQMYLVHNRPPDFMGSYATVIILIFAAYYLFPISLRFRCVPALLYSTGSMAIFFAYKEPAFASSNFAIPIAVAFANFVGFFGSRQYDRTRRTQYLRMTEELQTINALDHTLAKLKTLTGLLPICAACKKIRNNEGYWDEIEKYISSHSEAEFSLGICADCKQEMEAENA